MALPTARFLRSLGFPMAARDQSPETRAALELTFDRCFTYPFILCSLGNVIVFLILISTMGPLGTQSDLEIYQRFLYGFLCALIAWPNCYLSSVAAIRMMRFSPSLEMGLICAATLSSVYGAMVVTTIVRTADTLFRPWNKDMGLFEIYGVVLVILGAANFLLFLVILLQVRQSGLQRGSDVPSGNAPPSVSGSGGPEWQDPGGADADLQQGEEGNGADRKGNRGGDGIRALASMRREPSVGVFSSNMVTSRALGAIALHNGFLSRLPEKIAKDIVYLKAEDHYLNVYSRDSQDVLLATLSGAVVELGNIGLQVHRSYWVSYRHIRNLVEVSGRYRLCLTGDHRVPVSRTYLQVVRAYLKAQGSSAPFEGRAEVRK